MRFGRLIDAIYILNGYVINYDSFRFLICETIKIFSETNLTLRFPLVVKAFWQTAHRKGLSPVCVRMWICKADDDEKFLRQTPQRCFDD